MEHDLAILRAKPDLKRAILARLGDLPSMERSEVPADVLEALAAVLLEQPLTPNEVFLLVDARMPPVYR